MAFIPCVYFEHETTEIEDLSWYLQGQMLTLEQTSRGLEITEHSRVVFLEDWDDEGHVLPEDLYPEGPMDHEKRRQWLRETLEHMQYAHAREP